MSYVWCLAASIDSDCKYYETYMVFTTFEKAKKQLIDDALIPLTLAEAIHDMSVMGAKFKLVDENNNKVDYTTYDPQTTVFPYYATGTFETGTTEVYRIFNDAEINEFDCDYDCNGYEIIELNGYRLTKIPLN